MVGSIAALWSSVVAVVGTLAGGLLAGVVQGRVARAARREARGDARQAEALAAVTALVAALADHRRAMWVLEDRRLTGAGEQSVADAVATSHLTRSAVTAPLVTVRILLPTLARSATDATQASFAMRGAPDHTALEHLRRAALDASDRLVDAAATVFAAHAAVMSTSEGGVA